MAAGVPIRTPEATVGALADAARALCDAHPLYPGFRGYTTYVT